MRRGPKSKRIPIRTYPHDCQRCGYHWRGKRNPQTCANRKCRSYYWRYPVTMTEQSIAQKIRWREARNGKEK